MDSLERIIRAAPLPPSLTNGQGHRRALVHASLATAVGRKGRHLTGTFCLTGDTMEGIIQCLVFLKAFSVSLCCWNKLYYYYCFQNKIYPLWVSRVYGLINILHLSVFIYLIKMLVNVEFFVWCRIDLLVLCMELLY